jgi:hypothetical protein
MPILVMSRLAVIPDDMRGKMAIVEFVEWAL